MERKIGEIFEYNGEWYQCVESDSCGECDLRNIICQRDTSINNPFKECSGNYRTDKKNIIFKKLEKVGEPYELDGYLFQSYHTFEVPIFTENYATVRESGNNSKISIEIKQNKEDMEEKNLKPFDLQKAREGKPVCTRDGRKARIICFDLQSIEKTPIVAAVHVTDKQEVISHYYEDGRQFVDGISELDLMMLPEKKEGWVNVYRDCDGANITKDDNIYSSKDAAIASAQIIDGDNYIATTIIKWEE